MKQERLSVHQPGIIVPICGELGMGFTGTVVSLGSWSEWVEPAVQDNL